MMLSSHGTRVVVLSCLAGVIVVSLRLWASETQLSISSSVLQTASSSKCNSTATPVVNSAETAVVNYGGSSWCPSAECHTSELCQPCKRRFLIIFAAGRSGSTTLTWMMDSLPGIRMSGENYGLLEEEFLLHKKLFVPGNFGSGQRTKGAWYRNKVPDGALSCILQNAVEIITPPKYPIHNSEEEASTIIGFKNIRFWQGTSDMEAFVKYLKSNLPCAKYLINVRSNTTALAASRKDAFFPNKGDKELKKNAKKETKQLKKLYKALGPEHAYLLDSSQWLGDVSILNKAVDWLGFNASCHFKHLLEFNVNKYKHGSTTFGDDAFPETCVAL